MSKTEELRTLKYIYKIAYELTKASSNGDKPSADLLDNEAKALAALNEARAALLAALGDSG